MKLFTLKWFALLVTSMLAGMPISAAALVMPISNYKNFLFDPKSAATCEIHHWFVGADIGLMQTCMKKRIMTVFNGSNYPPPANVDQYSLNSPQPFFLDLKAGYRWNRQEQWIPSYALGLRYQHIFIKNMTGMVTQYSDTDFKNYSYTWGVSADVISLYYKLDLVRFNCFMLYVDAGLGVSFNQSNDYHETAVPHVLARYSPDYASTTNTQFAYNVGAGIDFMLTNNLIMSAGYSYQSLGNVNSGFGQGPNWHNAQLKSGRLKSNMGLIGVSYFFE